jgi:hypothetical protein
MFCESVIKKPYMFRSLFYDHLQGSSFVLTTFRIYHLAAACRQPKGGKCAHAHCMLDS